jgi:hypothetical protein
MDAVSLDPNRRRLPRVSEAWLREHEIESAKHTDVI